MRKCELITVDTEISKIVVLTLMTKEFTLELTCSNSHTYIISLSINIYMMTKLR